MESLRNNFYQLFQGKTAMNCATRTIGASRPGMAASEVETSGKNYCDNISMAPWQKIAKMAVPMCFSSVLMLFGTLVNVRNIGLFNPEYLYILALYLPVSYLLIALFESMRVCSVFLLINKKEDLMASLLEIIGMLCALIGLLTLVFYLFRGVFPGTFYSFSIRMIGFSFISGTYYLLSSGLYVLKKGGIALLINLLTTLSNCVVTYISLTQFNRGIFAMVDGMVISSGFFIVILALLHFFIHKKDAISIEPVGVVLCGDPNDGRRQSARPYSSVESAKKIKFNWQRMKKNYQTCIPLAIPVFISYAVTFMGMFFLNKIVGQFGESNLSGFGLGMRIQSLVILPAFSIGITMAILSAENGEKHRIKSKGLLLSFYLYAAIAILLTIISPKLVQVMTNVEEIQTATLSYLKMVVPSYVGFGLMLTFIIYLEQIGKTKLALMLNFAGFFIPISLGGSMAILMNSPTFLYMSLAIMNFISLIIVYLISRAPYAHKKQELVYE